MPYIPPFDTSEGFDGPAVTQGSDRGSNGLLSMLLEAEHFETHESLLCVMNTLDAFEIDDLGSVVLPDDFKSAEAGTFGEFGDLLFSSPGLIVHDAPAQDFSLQQPIDHFQWPRLYEDTTSSTASEAADPLKPAPPGDPAPGVKAAAGKAQRRAEQNRWNSIAKRRTVQLMS